MTGKEPFAGDSTGDSAADDKPRIDREVRQVRPQDAPAGNADDLTDLFVSEGDALEASMSDLETGLVSDLELVRADLAERTTDLQRLHAEYANYRKRIERDRELVREQAVASAAAELLPVLDDVERAREHGELDGAFKVVGDSLEAIVAKLGLEAFGTEGDLFDPTMHEAFMHEFSADVTEPTCVRIFRRGYRQGDRIVRPAQVSVADPEEAA